MRSNFDYDEIIHQFLNFLNGLGIQPYDERDIVIDGELHRYRTHDDKSYNLSGAYCIYPEGLPAGFAQDWRKGIKATWKYDTSDLDDEHQAYYNSEEFKRKAEQERRKADEKRQQAKMERSEVAAQLWETLKEVPDDHPYLLSKHIQNYGLRYNPYMKALCVPLRNISGRIMSIQWIPDEPGQHKTFFKGAMLDGAFWCLELFTIGHEDAGVILLGEGMATMAKVYELTNYPCVAAMSCHRLLGIASILRKAYPNCTIVICADNDLGTEQERGYNPGLREAKSVVKRGYADAVIYPKFESADKGTDWDDYAILHGDAETAHELMEQIRLELRPENIKEMSPHVDTINAQALRKIRFDPIKWAVEGFLPSGLTILGGGPKVGKSMLALHLGLGVAIGGCVLGKIKVEQGDVLYLALEDTKRRLQERILGSDIDDDDDLSCLDLITRIPRQHEGGLDYIKWWLEEHPCARLVIVDTLQKFRKQLNGKSGVYGEDYDVITELKDVADKYDVAFLVLHHLKKVNPKEEMQGDWINQFSGSIGLSGSADTLFILRRARTDKYGTLYRTGRDVEEKNFRMRLDGYGWVLEEDADTFTMPTWKKQILDYLREHQTVTPTELAEALDLSSNTAQKNLSRLAEEGVIRKSGRGVYEIRREAE